MEAQEEYPKIVLDTQPKIGYNIYNNDGRRTFTTETH
jgi:hypothetical protein